MQLLETNGPSRKATPNEKTHSRAAVSIAEERGALKGYLEVQLQKCMD